MEEIAAGKDRVWHSNRTENVEPGEEKRRSRRRQEVEYPGGSHIRLSAADGQTFPVTQHPVRYL